MKTAQIYFLAFTLSVAASALQAATLTNISDPALTGATVETLDSATTQSFTTLTVGDLTFTALGNSLNIVSFGTGAFGYGDGGQVLSTQALGGSGFRMDFAQTVSSFGMTFEAANTIWDVVAYDADGNIIDTAEFDAGVGSRDWFRGLSTTGNISYVTFDDRDFADFILIDNVAYVPSSLAPVPLPAGGVLLLSALGIVGAYRARRSAR